LAPFRRDLENNELEMRNWISKVHSLIIGPGLGRSECAFKSVKVIELLELKEYAFQSQRINYRSH